MSNFFYYQVAGGEEVWAAAPTTQIQNVRQAKRPMFITALAVEKIISDDMPKAEMQALKYSGDFYLDWDDAHAPETTAPHAVRCIEKMKALGVEPESLLLYATGGKGFHCTVPAVSYMEKQPKQGTPGLPHLYKEMALELVVETLDLRVYTARRGRMWREPNVQRPNGKYKVPITWAELQAMDATLYHSLTANPRPEPARAAPAYALDFAVLFAKCQQKITSGLTRKRAKPVTHLTTQDLPSFTALCEGRGIRTGKGFHELALQVAVMANARGWTEDAMIAACQGLIDSHVSDGQRYDTSSKRSQELRRMFSYTEDNPCYELSVGALKSVLSHSAPDLDGVPIDKEAIDDNISRTASGDAEEIEEFADVAGVTLTRFGVYVNTEFGQKRVCAVSFEDVSLLKSLDTDVLSCLEAMVLVNGKTTKRQALELDVFHTLQNFNRFCSRLGHAFQGTDSHVRGMYMRAVEMAKKSGRQVYVTTREGLDIVNIPNHENPALREPFMIWSDGRGVVLERRVENEGVQIQFQGYPDQRGQFRSDLGDAPGLSDWLKEPGNKTKMAETLTHMLSCQRPAAIGQMLGWMTACFYRMLFHKTYGQFPILHVNGAAGAGKTALTQTFLSLFYYNQEPKMLSPTSTAFAITYAAAGSVTPPLVVDEYKPHEMLHTMHDKLKLTFRDGYNGREVLRGGGTRDNDDYRALHSSSLLAPMCFIAEAVEEETALLERVVLVTLAKPGAYENSRNFTHFMAWREGKQNLALLGKYLAAQTLRNYSLEQLRVDFDALYKDARKTYLLNGDDLAAGLPAEKLQEKQQAKERTVYNFTVAKFGLLRFKALIQSIYGKDFQTLFGEKFAEMESGVYDRMSDLYSNTQAEWLKVFNCFAEMSYGEENSPYLLRQGIDYAQITYHGKPCVELYLRSAYSRYRIYCRAVATKPLYQGETPFVHGLKDCPALAAQNVTESLNVPGGSHIFSELELTRLGFRGFKS